MSKLNKEQKGNKKNCSRQSQILEESSLIQKHFICEIFSFSSSYLLIVFKLGVLKTFTRKNLCWSVFLIKLKTSNFIEKRLQHRCFPVKIEIFLRALFSQNTSGQLLLFICRIHQIHLNFLGVYMFSLLYYCRASLNSLHFLFLKFL